MGGWQPAPIASGSSDGRKWGNGGGYIKLAVCRPVDTGKGVLLPFPVEFLKMLGETCPEVAVVLLSATYDINSFNVLRQHSRGTSVGSAYLCQGRWHMGFHVSLGRNDGL